MVKLWDSLFSNLKEGGGRSCDNEEFRKKYGFMYALVASETATVISNPIHKKICKF